MTLWQRYDNYYFNCVSMIIEMLKHCWITQYYRNHIYIYIYISFQTSVFSNIGHSFVKTVTMVSGELDFESLFRLGVDPDRYEPIPYHGSAFLIWIIFIILIPIILNNMLVS